ncbi:cation diffusion facilitator family transporter [Persicirhabdus sediminis]|uniref:Cation transporter n=1 Tax=Persicirhabdus sediminis TaxID=454144 RepID=A0A8J7MBV4_9BACT|nr:cation diffusion facilitator family transporter [Persicirhabdus sediminis]MBK1789631.1 cation transporter [Persicirhabdus sediminis]
MPDSNRHQQQQQQQGQKVTLWGLFINLTIGIAKIIIGWTCGTKALLADGVHSLLDLISDFAVLLAFKFSFEPEDENHHYGHHKFTSLVQLFIGMLLIVFASGLVLSAFTDVNIQTDQQALGALPFIVALISLAVKEALFWWTRAVAKKQKSDLLMANAWHHRSDSVSSLAVAVTLLFIWLAGPDWLMLDDILTAVLASYLIFEAGKIVWKSCSDLMDTAPRQEIIDDLREHILTNDHAIAYHQFRVRKVGDFYDVDFHLQVTADLTIQQGHDVSGAVKQALLDAHPEVLNVFVHIEPATADHLVERGIHS